MTIGPAPEYMRGMPHHDPNQDYMIIKIEPDKDENGFNTGTTCSTEPYTPGKTIPHRWNHIFNIKGENGYTLPEGSWHPAKN